MPECPTCGAPLPADVACPFAAPEAEAPWAGDYEALARGELAHAAHRVLVARWVLHRAATRSAKVVEHARALAAAHRGEALPLRPPR